jgi:hypothetical protein
MWACSMSSGRRYLIGALDDTCMLIMTITCLGPKSISMVCVLIFTGHEIFNLLLVNICFMIVLALTLTIQNTYDGGNESSKLVGIIIFGGL